MSDPDRHPGAPLLEVDELLKNYGDLRAVDELSFTVHEGEFFTLLGPSGCGKTTTLMAIAGLQAADGGAIRLNGEDITTRAPEHRGMGVVFQNYALFPHMTVLQNVMYPLARRGVPRAEAARRARDALALVQLVDHDFSLPTEISGGQAQRVALARALVFEPAMLLMDEPLGALDRRLRQHLQFELRSIQARVNTTVIYVTHDQEEALVLSDRVAIMRDGRFEQLGDPATVYEEPVNSFVANFLGDSNQVEVTPVGRNGSAQIVEPVGHPGVRFEVSSNGSTSGQALLTLRPEAVAIGEGPAPAGHDHCEAEVEDIAFLGDHARVQLRAFGTTWWVRLETSAFKAHAIQAGQRVSLHWDRASARLLRP
jgi:putative spermidine/putrescine transport system ATP-binding protein